MKNNKKIILIITGIVLVLILVAASVLASRIWDPLWNPFRPSPEKALQEASLIISNAKSYYAQAKFGLVANQENQGAIDISLNFDGNNQIGDDKKQNTDMNFILSISTSGIEASVAGKTISMADDFFLRLDTIPSFPIETILASMGIDTSKIKSQWIRINQKNLESMGIIQGNQVSEQKQIKFSELFANLLQNKNIYIVKQEFKDENVIGKPAYHYLISINKDELAKMINEGLKAAAASQNNGIGGISFDASSALNKIGDLDFEIWIGKFNYEIYKVKTEKNIDASEFQKGASGNLKLYAEISFSDFNKEFKIEAPKYYKEIQDVLPVSAIKSLTGSQTKTGVKK
jgi:hypothetical protein